MQGIIYVEGKSSPPVFDSENENLKIVNESQVDSLPNAVFEQLEVIDLLEFFDDDSILKKILSKLRLISANQLKNKLSSFGLNVTLLGIVGSRYILEAQRQ